MTEPLQRVQPDYTTVLPSPLTQEAVTKKIRSDLGAPRRVVELDDFQLAAAISDALDLFNTYRVREVYGLYNNLSGRVIIPITNPEVFDVIQCDFLLKTVIDYENLNIFELDFRIKNLKGGSGDYFEYRMINEMNKRAFSSETEWFYDMDQRKLYLDARGGPWLVEYTMAIPFKLGNIPRGYIINFIKAVRAYAKFRLYEMRTKTPVMLPTGAEKMGENLKDEADKDIEQVIEWLQQPSAPIFG